MVENLLLGLGCLLLISLILIIKNNYKRIYLIFDSIKDSYRELDRKTENINSKIVEEKENINIISDKLKNITKQLELQFKLINKSVDKVKETEKDTTKDDDISTKLKPGERLLFSKELKLNFDDKFIQLDSQGNEVKYSGNNTKEIPKEIIEKLKVKTVNKEVKLDNQAKGNKSIDDSKMSLSNDKEAANNIKEDKKRDEISLNKRRSIRKRRKKYKVVIKENEK